MAIYILFMAVFAGFGCIVGLKMFTKNSWGVQVATLFPAGTAKRAFASCWLVKAGCSCNGISTILSLMLDLVRSDLLNHANHMVGRCKEEQLAFSGVQVLMLACYHEQEAASVPT